MFNEADPFACFGSENEDEGEEDVMGRDSIPARFHRETTDSLASLSSRMVSEANARLENALIHHLPIVSPSFEVFDHPIPEHGKGVRALRTFKCGDEIAREGAVMRVLAQQAAASEEEAHQLFANEVTSCFATLSPETKEAYMSLTSCEQYLNADVGSITPVGIYQTNSYQLLNEKKSGLFLTLARINHSCRPNSNHCWRPDLQKTLIFATRDIAIGEEICTSYGPSELMNTSGRRDYLRDRLSFECTCEMCLEGNSKGADDKALQVDSLYENLSLLIHQGRYDEALESVDHCLVLLEELGYAVLGANTKPFLRYGYEIALNGLQDLELARSYLEREYTAVRNSEGLDGYTAIKIQNELEDLGTKEIKK